MNQTSRFGSNGRYRILKNTFRVRVNPTQPSTIYIEIAVLDATGKYETHPWKLYWEPQVACPFSKHDRAAFPQFIPVAEDPPTTRLTCGPTSKSFTYSKSYYELKISEDSGDMCRKTDVLEEPFREFKFQKMVPRLASRRVCQISSVLVTLIIGSSNGDQWLKSKSNQSRMTMWEKGILTDVVIKTASADFPCHKFMLACESDYFKSMFETDMKEKRDSVVDWVEVADSDTVRDMLHYIYSGETPPSFKDTCLALTEVSHMCLMDDLKRLCAFQLREVISLENMGDILRLAAKQESQELQDLAVSFIVDNYEADGNGAWTAPWESLEPGLAKIMFSSMMRNLVRRKKSRLIL